MKNEDMWQKHDLFPAGESNAEFVKSMATDDLAKPNEEMKVGIVRIGRPRAMALDERFKLPVSQQGSTFWLVRLSFEFDIHPEFDEKMARFISARCATQLWPARDGDPQPTAYAVLPDRLDEGPTKVCVKISPTLQLEELKASVGEATFDVTIGTAQPVIVGWKGEDERAPYWRLTPRTKQLIGEQNLWIVVEMPHGTAGVAISASATAQVETPQFKCLPMALKEKSSTTDERPRYLLTI